MGRSKYKQKFIPYFLQKKINLNKKKPIKVQQRNAVITNECIGLEFFVHNGKDYIPIIINPKMVGHKFGEFAFTRVKYNFKK